MDSISRERRSRNMSLIGSKDTKPEMLLRKKLFSCGYRYRVHYRVGGVTVDVAFPARKKAINVHGCFWHQHPGCNEASKPKSNQAFWRDKLQRNITRDEYVSILLNKAGWDILVVWECDLEKNLRSEITKTVAFILG